jgi:hypothetical protein
MAKVATMSENDVAGKKVLTGAQPSSISAGGRLVLLAAMYFFLPVYQTSIIAQTTRPKQVSSVLFGGLLPSSPLPLTKAPALSSVGHSFSPTFLLGLATTPVVFPDLPALAVSPPQRQFAADTVNSQPSAWCEELPQAPDSSARQAPHEMLVTQSPSGKDIHLSIPTQPQPASNSAVSSEGQLLRSLEEQERLLLEDYGPDYFRVKNLRARIVDLKDHVRQKNALQPIHATASYASEGGPVGTQVVDIRLKVELPESHALAPEVPIHKAKEELERGAEEQEEQAFPRPVSRARSSEDASSRQLPAEENWWSIILLHLGAIAAGLLLGLTIHFPMVWYLMRRFASRSAHSELEVAIASSKSQPPPSGVLGLKQFLIDAPPPSVTHQEMLNSFPLFDLGAKRDDEWINAWSELIIGTEEQT